jgi:hypothetical protein
MTRIINCGTVYTFIVNTKVRLAQIFINNRDRQNTTFVKYHFIFIKMVNLNEYDLPMSSAST